MTSPTPFISGRTGRGEAFVSDRSGSTHDRFMRLFIAHEEALRGFVRALSPGREEAREVIAKLPANLAGRLFVDERGGVVNDVDRVVAGRCNAIECVRGGGRPSSAEIDRALIERIVETFGWEGLKEPSRDPGMK